MNRQEASWHPVTHRTAVSKMASTWEKNPTLLSCLRSRYFNSLLLETQYNFMLHKENLNTYSYNQSVERTHKYEHTDFGHA